MMTDAKAIYHVSTNDNRQFVFTSYSKGFETITVDFDEVNSEPERAWVAVQKVINRKEIIKFGNQQKELINEARSLLLEAIRIHESIGHRPETVCWDERVNVLAFIAHSLGIGNDVSYNSLDAGTFFGKTKDIVELDTMERLLLRILQYRDHHNGLIEIPDVLETAEEIEKAEQQRAAADQQQQQQGGGSDETPGT